MELSLVERALRLAAKAHRHQVRKDDDLPYIAHPVMVAWMLRERGFSDTVVAAALAHDVLEDTDVPAEALEQELGSDVLRIVRAVSNDDSLSWREKKEKYIETVRAAGVDVKAVATADKIHNAQSLLAAHDRLGSEVWKKFNTGREEKLWFEEAMYQMLSETWDHPLVEEYGQYVARMRALV